MSPLIHPAKSEPGVSRLEAPGPGPHSPLWGSVVVVVATTMSLELMVNRFVSVRVLPVLECRESRDFVEAIAPVLAGGRPRS